VRFRHNRGNNGTGGFEDRFGRRQKSKRPLTSYRLVCHQYPKRQRSGLVCQPSMTLRVTKGDGKIPEPVAGACGDSIEGAFSSTFPDLRAIPDAQTRRFGQAARGLETFLENSRDYPIVTRCPWHVQCDNFLRAGCCNSGGFLAY
jgi:hypothetical protein